MVIIDICIKHLLQLTVGLLDLALILTELHIDLVYFLSHCMIFVEDLFELFLHISKQLVKQAFVFLKFTRIKL